MRPVVSLFGGYYAGAAATLAYERRWISPLVFPLVLWLFFFDILCAPLIAAHEALVRFSADIVSIGEIIISPTRTTRWKQITGWTATITAMKPLLLKQAVDIAILLTLVFYAILLRIKSMSYGPQTASVNYFGGSDGDCSSFTYHKLWRTTYNTTPNTPFPTTSLSLSNSILLQQQSCTCTWLQGIWIYQEVSWQDGQGRWETLWKV